MLNMFFSINGVTDKRVGQIYFFHAHLARNTLFTKHHEADTRTYLLQYESDG